MILNVINNSDESITLSQLSALYSFFYFPVHYKRVKEYRIFCHWIFFIFKSHLFRWLIVLLSLMGGYSRLRRLYSNWISLNIYANLYALLRTFCEANVIFVTSWWLVLVLVKKSCLVNISIYICILIDVKCKFGSQVTNEYAKNIYNIASF